MVKHVKTGVLALVAASGMLATVVWAADKEAPAAQACQCPHHAEMGQEMDGPGMGPDMDRPGMGPMAMRGGFRHGMERMPQPGGPGMMAMLPLRGLELTDAQKAKVKELLEGEREAMKAQHQSQRKAMQELLTAAKFDEAKAKKLLAQQQDERDQQQLQRLKLQNQIFQLLTPEQQAKVKARLEKMPAGDEPQDE